MLGSGMTWVSIFGFGTNTISKKIQGAEHLRVNFIILATDKDKLHDILSLFNTTSSSFLIYNLIFYLSLYLLWSFR